MILGLLGACKGPVKEAPLLWDLLPNEKTGIDFRNDLNYTEQVNPYTFRNFYNGAGVALGDINQDGLIDIFFTGNQTSNRLYLNKGNLQFEDITESAGLNSQGVWSTGVSMADINQDGLLDIYVCKSGPPGGNRRKNELFINQGNSTFSEEAEKYGLAEEGLSQHAVFFDFDKDGDLDMYLLSNSGRSVGIYDLREGQRETRDPDGGNKLFRNDGETFTDVSESAGIYGSSIGYGLGVTVADLNDDSWPDLYVSNDFFERDYIYINNQDGTFTESLTQMLPEISLGSMGADIADLDNDAKPEIFVTEMLPRDWERIKTKTPFEDWDKQQANVKAGYHWQFTRNTLQRNLGNPSNSILPVFSEISRFTQTDATDWSWGALIFDGNNDGLKDIFVANGIVKDLTDFDFVDFYTDQSKDVAKLKEDSLLLTTMIDQFPSQPLANYWFENKGNWDFENQAASSGLNQLTFSTGSAYGDLDNDGDLELVVNNQNDYAAIYKNNSRELGIGNFLQLDLGSAFGAKVKLYLGDRMQYQEYQPVKGYLSSVSSIVHFGLGSDSQIDSLEIFWPNGTISKSYQIPANQRLVPNPSEAKQQTKNPHSAEPLFNIRQTDYDILHRESDFIDFDRDRLRFWMISNEGPRVSQADVNSDGRDDFFLPGARGYSSELWIQNSKGDFVSVLGETFAEDSLSEDVVAHFFDANGDGQLDLIVGSGGIEYGNYNSAYQDRLYLNQGDGRFTKIPSSFSLNPTSFILNLDLDKDGDQDLIIGSRALPFEYGIPAPLSVWINDGKANFTDQSIKYLGASNALGMITDGALADLDQDGKTELIICGEWMPIRIFTITDSQWEERTQEFGFNQTEGLWQRLLVQDINSDGMPDILGGNWGLNSRIRTSPDTPLELFIYDFDQNGALDPILTQRINNNAIPLVLKSTLLKQIPSLRKQLLTYEAYKNKSLADLFEPDLLSKSLTLRANTLVTSLWLNQGDGAFESVTLPIDIQMSPVFAIAAISTPNEAYPLLVYGGNQSKIKPEMGTQMGSYGGLLRTTDGKAWKSLSLTQSGLFFPGETRDIVQLNSTSGTRMLVFRNDDEVLEFEIKK